MKTHNSVIGFRGEDVLEYLPNFIRSCAGCHLSENGERNWGMNPSRINRSCSSAIWSERLTVPSLDSTKWFLWKNGLKLGSPGVVADFIQHNCAQMLHHDQLTMADDWCGINNAVSFLFCSFHLLTEEMRSNVEEGERTGSSNNGRKDEIKIVWISSSSDYHNKQR